jgi:hypothetical protein
MFRKSCFLLPLFLLILCSVVAGQQSSAAKGINRAGAPVPTPLLNGKKAFISFDLGDTAAFPTVYSGGPERAYSEFFAGVKQWGRYEVVLDPRDADLIFAIRFVESPALSTPQIRMVVTDAKTHVVLWGFVEAIDGAFFKKHRDQAFSGAVDRIVNDFQELLSPNSPLPFPPTDAAGTR